MVMKRGCTSKHTKYNMPWPKLRLPFFQNKLSSLLIYSKNNTWGTSSHRMLQRHLTWMHSKGAYLELYKNSILLQPHAPVNRCTALELKHKNLTSTKLDWLKNWFHNKQTKAYFNASILVLGCIRWEKDMGLERWTFRCEWMNKVKPDISDLPEK